MAASSLDVSRRQKSGTKPASTNREAL
jgi:hypothetical protein